MLKTIASNWEGKCSQSFQKAQQKDVGIMISFQLVQPNPAKSSLPTLMNNERHPNTHIMSSFYTLHWLAFCNHLYKLFIIQLPVSILKISTSIRFIFARSIFVTTSASAISSSTSSWLIMFPSIKLTFDTQSKPVRIKQRRHLFELGQVHKSIFVTVENLKCLPGKNQLEREQISCGLT